MPALFRLVWVVVHVLRSVRFPHRRIFRHTKCLPPVSLLGSPRWIPFLKGTASVGLLSHAQAHAKHRRDAFLSTLDPSQPKYDPSPRPIVITQPAPLWYPRSQERRVRKESERTS